MNLLGGVLFRNPSRRIEAWELRAMAARVAGAGEPNWITSGPVGFFVRGGPRLKTEDPVIVAADCDLWGSLLEELLALSGSGGRGLEGWKGLQRLRGGFAFALWDRSRRQLLLAVDRFGIKRLYYTKTKEGLAFASRPTALLAFPGVEQQVDPTAVYHYLNFGFIPAPYSIFMGIRRLPPGHILVVGDGEPVLRQYWDLTYLEQPLGLREGVATTAQLLEEAVAFALRGTIPKETGAFLSGGLDTSTLVGLMGKVTGERVNASSIGFHEPGYNELPYAERAARHFYVIHSTAILTPDEAMEVMPHLLEAYDEPLGNDSTIAAYWCARLARDAGMTRLLAGDGDDELFGGNERYRTDRLFAAYGRIPRFFRQAFIEPLLFRFPDGGTSLFGRARRYVQRANTPILRRFYHYEFFIAREAVRLLNPEFLEAVDLEAPWRIVQAYFDGVRATSDLNRLLYLDIKLTIGDNDLLKVTRTAELAGIEVRFPFLDDQLVEFTTTLPARYKVRGLEKRYLFKRAFKDLLPPEILTKPKHGFGLPVSGWLKTHQGFRQLARETLGSSEAWIRRYLRPEAIEGLFRAHESDETSYYGSLLWRLLMFELWHRRHGEGKGAG